MGLYKFHAAHSAECVCFKWFWILRIFSDDLYWMWYLDSAGFLCAREDLPISNWSLQLVPHSFLHFHPSVFFMLSEISLWRNGNCLSCFNPVWMKRKNCGLPAKFKTHRLLMWKVLPLLNGALGAPLRGPLGSSYLLCFSEAINHYLFSLLSYNTNNYCLTKYWVFMIEYI